MKKCFYLFAFILTIYATSAEWTQRVSVRGPGNCISFGKTAYFGSINGILKYDVLSHEREYYSSVNSDLCGNYINDMYLMEDGNILVSTDKGLSMIVNGSITSKEPICSDYPDYDSRFIYKDSLGHFWTFSSQKVHQYKDGKWNSIDLSTKVNHKFDIMFLFVDHDKIWAAYEDNRKTSTTFYGSMRDDYLHLVVIADTGIVRLFDSISEFPYRQGDYHLLSLNNHVVLKNYDGTYIYNDTTWSNPDFLYPSSEFKSSNYQGFVIDQKGNIWYNVFNNDGSISYPVSYNIKDGKLTEYLKDKKLDNVAILSDSTIVSYSPTMLYVKNDTGWVEISFSKSLSINDPLYYIPIKIDGKIYIKITYAYKSKIPEGTFICLENTNLNFFFGGDFPFFSLKQLAINKKQQGFFNGENPGSPYMMEKDSGFYKLDMTSNVFYAKPCGDGKVYFSYERNKDTSLSNNYLSTWEGNDSKKIDLGYGKMKGSSINMFDVSGTYIAALASYYLPGTDSLESYIALMNTSNQKIEIFDKSNSQMPDYYLYKSGLSWYYLDTVPRSISIDKYMNIWVSTSESLIKVGKDESKIYEIPNNSYGYKLYISSMAYDEKSEELLCSSVTPIISTYKSSDVLHFFNIPDEKWDSIKVSNAGLHGNMIIFKKLLDNRIWASDDMGYLYRYAGNGKFEEFDLEINGKKSIGIKINDFSIDVNNYLHLGTDIGLFTNKTLLTAIPEETQLTNGFEIYPNPAFEYIEISVGSRHALTNPDIRIFNVFGETVVNSSDLNNSQFSILNSQLRIDVSGLPSGVYFVRVGDKVGKFVKI